MFTTLMTQTSTLRNGFMCALKALVPLMLRLLFGFSFMMAGWMKLNMLPKVVEGFTGAGIPWAGVMAPFVAVLEFVGGILLMVGLGTRVVAFLLAFTMIVALMTAHVSAFSQGLQGVMSAGPFSYLIAMLVLLTYGAGKLSVDALLCHKCCGGNCGCGPGCKCSCCKGKK